MKKVLKVIVIVIAVGFIVAQFIRPDQTNPPIDNSQTLETSLAIPDDVEAILKRSCNDCHSNTTAYPWYAQVSPFSWFLDNHIRDGRRQMNLSEWGSYDARRKNKKMEQVCEQVQTGEMPLPSYLWIHRSSELSDAEIARLCDWSSEVRQTLQ